MLSYRNAEAPNMGLALEIELLPWDSDIFEAACRFAADILFSIVWTGIQNKGNMLFPTVWIEE